MSDLENCRVCGAQRPIDAPSGLCPACLLKEGLAEEKTAAGVPAVAQPGTIVAERYKLLERIGEGGMGEVWVADQLEPIKRRVALKLIKPGMDSRNVLGRFEAERQALAVMDHPNIAKVLDAGATAAGRPYFVMELVKGTPITEFCDARRLTPRQRLELFVPVCQAIQHAHQKGIIHRDIKPSNVLVALHDERPVPKVIDFGVAKAIGPQLTEKTIYTGFGALVGTPAYMAPEQATFNQLDVDTRADVYALGVLLYELLVGSPPFEQARLEAAALDEVLRLIREEEPQRPSARLSTSQARASIAAVRQSDPARLMQVIRGELDWVVMKALEKDRNQRYETANGLASDVQRFLSGEPVQAVPPSLGYRFRKFGHKHRVMLTTTAAFVGLLFASVALTSWLAVWANQERKVAIGAQDLERQARRRAESERNRAIDAEANARDEAKRADAQTEAARKSLYAARVNLARRNWQEGNGGGAREILDACELELINDVFDASNGGRDRELLDGGVAVLHDRDERGWEWHYLNRVCRQELRTIVAGEWSIHSLDFSADGSRLVAGSHNGRVVVWDIATGKELVVLKGHKEPVRHVVFSPDKKRLATASDDHTIRLWDALTGEQLATDSRRASLSFFRGLAFNGDGTQLATVDGEGIIRIFSGATLQSLASFRIPLGENDLTLGPLAGAERPEGVQGVPERTVFMPMMPRCAFGRGFERFASLRSPLAGARPPGWWAPGPNGEIVLGDLSRPDAALRPLHPDPEWISELTISEDGRWVAASSSGAPLQTWDVSGNEDVRHVFEGSVNGLRVLRFNPMATRLVCGDDRGAIKVWQVPEGKLLRTFVGAASPVSSLAFSADGSRLVSGHADGTVRLWDFTPAQLRADKSILTREIRIGPVANSLFSSESKDSEPILWTGETTLGMKFPIVTPADVAAGENLQILETKHEFQRIAFTQDGGSITAFSEQHGGSVWDAATLLPIDNVAPDRPANAELFDAVRLSDGEWLMVESSEGSLQLLHWEKTSVRSSRTVGHFTEGVHDAVLSRDGRLVAALVGNGEFSIWDAKSGANLWSIVEPREPEGSFFPDGKINFSSNGRLFAASYGEKIQVWNISERRRIQLLADHRTKKCPCLTIDEKGGLLAAGNDNLVRIWNLKSGEELSALRGHTEEVTSLAFSPDGKRIVSGSRDRTIKVWEPRQGSELLTLPGHTGHVNSLSFSPDGYRLVSTGSDQTIRVYDARPPSLELQQLSEALGIAEWLVQSAKTRAELAERIEAHRGICDVVRQQVRELAPGLWSAEIELRSHELVSRRFEKLFLKSDVLASLKSDETLDVEMRLSALDQAGQLEENPYTLKEAAWAIAIRPDAEPDEYARAVRLAEGAISLLPENATFLSILGAAQYRAGRWADAVASLERSLATSAISGAASEVVDLAFLAMAHHSLGRTDVAKQLLNRLEDLAERKVGAGEPTYDKLLAEAREKLAETERSLRKPDESPKQR